MSLSSSTCKLLLVSIMLMTLCPPDVDAGWFRFRVRWRKVWRVAKPYVVRAVISYATGYLVNSDCPEAHIISRSDWSAGSPSGSPQSTDRFNKVYIYDHGQDTCIDQTSCERLLRVIQDTDRLDGFSDIKPNFLIGQDGQIYEGRGWDIVGDYHRTDPNDESIGVAFMGDFSGTAPNQASLDALRTFLDCSQKLMTNPALDVEQGTPIYDVIKTWGKQQK